MTNTNDSPAQAAFEAWVNDPSHYSCARSAEHRGAAVPATIIRYAAPWCSDECAERAGDFNTEDGNMMLEQAHEQHDGFMAGRASARSPEQEAAIAGLVNEATDLCRALESGPESWKAARVRVALAAARLAGLTEKE